MIHHQFFSTARTEIYNKMGSKSRDRKEIKSRAQIAQKLGYHIISIVAKERQLATEWLREAGQEEEAKELEG